MCKLSLLFTSLSLIISGANLFAQTDEGKQVEIPANGINWVSYEDALKQAKDQDKYVAVLFTGSDWCSWCIKLEKEALASSEFQDAINDKFIFVKVDFPLKTKLPSDVSKKNEELKKQYQIQGFPTFVVLNSKGAKVGTTGYAAGGGAKFAEILLNFTK